MRVYYILIGAFILTSCVSSKKYEEATAQVSRLRVDSISLENRIRKLVDEKDYLENKSAQTEQALNQRLQEKEDSLNAKEKLLRDREFSLSDMKSRKEQEEESFRKLAKSVHVLFTDLSTNDVSAYTNCSQIIVEVSDRLLFAPNSIKPDTKSAVVFARIKEALSKNTDLNLMVIAHTDTFNHTKEKINSLTELGAAKSQHITELLLKESGITHQRIFSATRGASVKPGKGAIGLGRNRIELVFYSNLLPCIYSKD